MIQLATANAQPIGLTIHSRQTWGRHYWQDLLQARYQILALSWMFFNLRYKQTAIGLVWTLLKPLMMFAIFTFIFSRFYTPPAQLETSFPLLVIAAVIPWHFFSSFLTEGCTGLVNYPNLIKTLCFPKMIILLAIGLAALIDFMLYGAMMMGLGFYYHLTIQGTWVFLPVLVGITFLLGLGCALWTSSLCVQYRDVKYLVPYFVQIITYLSPIGFMPNLIPVQYTWLYGINPLVGLIELWRWVLCAPTYPLTSHYIVMSLLVTLIILISGVWCFLKLEPDFPDYV